MNKKTFEIFLPVPPKELRGNSRCHWRKKHEIFSKYKGIAIMLCRNQERFKEPFTRGDIYPTWYIKTKIRPDEDNAMISLKAYRDGFEAAGMIDNDKNFRNFPIDFVVRKEGILGVNLKIFFERD